METGGAKIMQPNWKICKTGKKLGSPNGGAKNYVWILQTLKEFKSSECKYFNTDSGKQKSYMNRKRITIRG